jgi:adenosylcobinamide-GDP ribazoletransferase
MQGFLFALQFLTIIPIKAKKEIDAKRLSLSAAYFPLVGLILGLMLAGVNKLLLFFPVEQFFRSVILVIFLIVLTRGLHLDGLADTSDALLSSRDKQQMLQIMRDSHIGTMGVLSLICIILLKLVLLYSLNSKLINISLILMCLLSRYALVFAMFLFPYIRSEGKAKVFVERMNWKIFSLATTTTLFCAIIVWGLKGLLVFLPVVIFIILIGKLITQKIGGMTGDTLGAINELVETFVLLNIFVLTI